MNKKFISLILAFVFLFCSTTMTIAVEETDDGKVAERMGFLPSEEYEEMYEKIVIRGDDYFSYPASRETDIFGDLSREEIERILKGLAKEAFIDEESICYPTNVEKEIFGDLSRERITEITFNLFSVKKNKTENIDKTSHELEEMITIYTEDNYNMNVNRILEGESPSDIPDVPVSENFTIHFNFLGIAFVHRGVLDLVVSGWYNKYYSEARINKFDFTFSPNQYCGTDISYGQMAQFSIGASDGSSSPYVFRISDNGLISRLA